MVHGRLPRRCRQDDWYFTGSGIYVNSTFALPNSTWVVKKQNDGPQLLCRITNTNPADMWVQVSEFYLDETLGMACNRVRRSHKVFLGEGNSHKMKWFYDMEQSPELDSNEDWLEFVLVATQGKNSNQAKKELAQIAQALNCDTTFKEIQGDSAFRRTQSWIYSCIRVKSNKRKLVIAPVYDHQGICVGDGVFFDPSSRTGLDRGDVVCDVGGFYVEVPPGYKGDRTYLCTSGVMGTDGLVLDLEYWLTGYFNTSNNPNLAFLETSHQMIVESRIEPGEQMFWNYGQQMVQNGETPQELQPRLEWHRERHQMAVGNGPRAQAPDKATNADTPITSSSTKRPCSGSGSSQPQGKRSKQVRQSDDDYA